MRRCRAALLVLFLLLIIGAVDIVYYYPRLPPIVASHFDVTGQADGWCSKRSFVIVWGATLSGITLVLLTVTLGISKLPSSLVRLPNKEYWLAPQRKEETYSFVSQSTLWLNNGTVAFLVALMHLHFGTNTRPVPRLGGSCLLLIVAYLIYTGIWCLVLSRRFRRPSSRAE